MGQDPRLRERAGSRRLAAVAVRTNECPHTRCQATQPTRTGHVAARWARDLPALSSGGHAGVTGATTLGLLGTGTLNSASPRSNDGEAVHRGAEICGCRGDATFVRAARRDGKYRVRLSDAQIANTKGCS